MTDNEIIKAFDDLVRNKIISLNLPLIIQMLLVDVLVVLNRQNAEIERLKEGIKFERERVDNIPNLLQQSKSEAVREFAERVNQLTTSYWFDNINKEHIDYIVKEIVKEMVGDEK